LKRYTNFSQNFGTGASTIKTPDYAFFIQDDWRATHRLTLNIGLRYDYQKFADPIFPNTKTASLVLGQTTYTQAQADAIVAQTGKFPSDKNNFGPRFGLAWDVFGDNRTTLRGGFGIYYGRVPNSFISSMVTATGATNTQYASGNILPTASNAPLFPGAISATTPPAVLAIVTPNPNLSNPKVYEGDIIFERQIAKNTAVSASYIFALGRQLPSFVDLNLNFPTTTRTYNVVGGPLNGQSFTLPFFTGARPISNFGAIIDVESNSRSEYNGLVLKAERRLTHGLQFQTSYTFSNAVDYGQQLGTFAPTFPTVTNPYDASLDRGRSNLDIRHRFIASAVWQVDRSLGWDKTGLQRAIFGGLTISPIYNLASGAPVDSFLSASPTGGTSNGLLGSGGPQRTTFIQRNKDSRPHTEVVDLRVSKRINISEGMNIELLAEAFNLFNRENAATSVGQAVNNNEYFFSSATNTLTYNAGQVSGTPAYLTPLVFNNSTVYTPRQIQLGLRFHF